MGATEYVAVHRALAVVEALHRVNGEQAEGTREERRGGKGRQQFGTNAKRRGRSVSHCLGWTECLSPRTKWIPHEPPEDFLTTAASTKPRGVYTPIPARAQAYSA